MMTTAIRKADTAGPGEILNTARQIWGESRTTVTADGRDMIRALAIRKVRMTTTTTITTALTTTTTTRKADPTGLGEISNTAP